jgi:hypothetical protein
MDRRQFLATSAAAVAGPTVLGATDKAGTKAARVGSGEHTYECVHNWGELPGSLEWQTTHNVAVDSQGLVYVTHQVTGKKDLDTVVVFDAAGKFVRSFGKQWHAGGHGLDIRKEGSDEFLYLCHMTNGGPVVKTTLTGEVVWSKGRPECKEYEDPAKPFKPTNVAFCPTGGFFVGDGYGSNYMLCYDKDGKLEKVFGGTGTGNGQFKTPHGNWVDARTRKNLTAPTLVVCDRANNRLQTFDLDGKHLSTTEKGAFFLPAHIDTHKNLMLVPDLQCRLTLLGLNGEVVAQLGDDPEWRARVVGSLNKKGVTPVRKQPGEWPAGKFVHPHDACFDAAGNIYVAEWVEPGRVSFLKKVG